MSKYGVVRTESKRVHIMQDETLSLCGRTMGETVPNMRTRLLCSECANVRQRLWEGEGYGTMEVSTPSEGDTMPAERSADEVKTDIDNALEAIGSADSEEKVTALSEQITEDLKRLRGAPKQQRAMRLKEVVASARERLVRPAEVVTASDWRTQMEGGEARAEELFKAGVERIRKGAELGTKAVSLYEEICNVILEGRLRLSYKGLPDLMARSQAARQLAADMFEEARKGIDPDAVDLQEFHRTLAKGVNNKMGDTVVGWLRALDASEDQSVFTATFPTVAAESAPPNASAPSQRLRNAYKGRLNIDLPENTRAEKAAIERARRKELEDKAKAGALEPAEQAELTGEATPAERATAGLAKLTSGVRAARKVTTEDVEALDAKARKAWRDQLEADITALRELFAKLV